jgi:hypothetical protein
MTTARVVSGAISLSSCTHLPLTVGSNVVKPVMVPPGRIKVSTNPWTTGSVTKVNTIGTVWVSSSIALSEGVAVATITSG